MRARRAWEVIELTVGIAMRKATSVAPPQRGKALPPGYLAHAVKRPAVDSRSLGCPDARMPADTPRQPCFLARALALLRAPRHAADFAMHCYCTAGQTEVPSVTGRDILAKMLHNVHPRPDKAAYHECSHVMTYIYKIRAVRCTR